MQKAVFQTNDDGLFLYESLANELALTPGTFNIPYGACEDMPPQAPTGKWPRRIGNAWVLVDDYRTTPRWVVETSMPYSIGSEHEGPDGTVRYPGWGPLPDWLTRIAPPAEQGPGQA